MGKRAWMELVGGRVRIVYRSGERTETSLPVQDARQLWRELGAALGDADTELARRRIAGTVTDDDRRAWGEEIVGEPKENDGEALVDPTCEHCGSETCIGRDYPNRCPTKLPPDVRSSTWGSLLADGDG